MSNKQRKKNERRQKRQKKRERQQVARELRLEPVTCQNCGERFGTADDPSVIHRGGPCDCTPEAREAMDNFLDARDEAYENAPGEKIACPTCGTMHGEDKQATCFFEGQLVWDGCDYCFEAQAAKFESIREERRERWFGPRPNPVASQAVPSKYMPPTVDGASIYAVATARPTP